MTTEIEAVTASVWEGVAVGSINDEEDVVVHVFELLGIDPDAPAGSTKMDLENLRKYGLQQ